MQTIIGMKCYVGVGQNWWEKWVNIRRESSIGPFGLRFCEHCQAANLDILSSFAPLTI